MKGEEAALERAVRGEVGARAAVGDGERRETRDARGARETTGAQARAMTRATEGIGRRPRRERWSGEDKENECARRRRRVLSLTLHIRFIIIHDVICATC